MSYLSLCDSAQDGCGKTFPSDLKNCPHCGQLEMFTISAHVNPRDYAYDIETYPNIFTCRVIHIASGKKWKFEISTRLNQYAEFAAFIHGLSNCGARGVGYNNVGFDYPVVHWMMHNPSCTVDQIYSYAMRIIDAMKKGDKFGFIVWDRDQLFPQVDLFKIHHFDNTAKMTSLKSLEFCMNMDSVEDLPFPVGQHLTPDQMDVLHDYNFHDTDATAMFYARTLDALELREKLSTDYGKDFTNFNDSKIGSEIFIQRLEKAGVDCFEYVGNKRQPKQTFRPTIKLADVIVPYIHFEHPELIKVHEWLKHQTLTDTKGIFNNLSATVKGLRIDFGTGGVHGCIDGKIYRSENGKKVQLRDVASYYPNLAIKNKWFPKHLGVSFCEVYEDLYNERRSYDKSHPANKALKLSLNGTYGNSNNVYSPFYDPFFTMQITINGQLLLCMLAERLLMAPSLELFNINTDGVAFIVDESELPYVDAVCDWWQNLTCLELETDHVKTFFSADVNNYIMEYE